MDAGAITVEFRDGAVREWSREAVGAGAMMEESRRGAKRVWADCTSLFASRGAGATMALFKAGAVRE